MPVRLGDTANYRHMGNEIYCWVREDVLWVVDYVTGSLVAEGSKPFHIGNGCPKSGACPGNTAHKTLQELDFDIPTYSGRPSTPWKGAQYENIWLEPWILDESKVDWWTTWQFLIRLKEFCSDDRREYQFILHEKVFALIAKNISNKERDCFYSIVTQDTANNFNHHLHIHCKIGVKHGTIPG